MINNNCGEINNSINLLYINNRKKILELIKMINSGLGNTSQTFFLSVYYMDLILSDKNFENIFKKFFQDNENDINIELKNKDLLLVSLACLILSTKFNENDPNVPNILCFVNLCSYYSNNKYIFRVNELTNAEVIALKFLKYKLNHFTIYHYFIFFFTHGFLFENIFENDKYNKDEILEKIYILSREIMDKYIEDYENINYILGKNAYFSSIFIIMLSTEYILNINLFKEKEKNIFELFYEINFNENKKCNDIIKNKIQKIYQDIKINEKKIKIKSNTENKNIINSSNKKANDNSEKFLYDKFYLKTINEPNLNNNLLISCDNYYLSKYKTNNNKMEINKILKNNYNSSLSKYKFISQKENSMSKSIGNYRYKQLFQFGNNNNNNKNIFINKYNSSLDKRTILEENENRMKNLINNLQISDNFINNKDSYKNNNLHIKYKIDDNKNKLKDFHKENNNQEFEIINPGNIYIKDNKLTNNKINNYIASLSSSTNKNDIIYKTKIILNEEKKNSKNEINKINIENEKPNFYYSRIYDNKTNYIINDRYSMKENIQSNNLTNSINFLQPRNKYINNIIIGKKSMNEKMNSYIHNLTENYKNENNKSDKNYFKGTYYQYDKLYQYENIDKYTNRFYKSTYFPY